MNPFRVNVTVFCPLKTYRAYCFLRFSGNRIFEHWLKMSLVNKLFRFENILRFNLLRSSLVISTEYAYPQQCKMNNPSAVFEGNKIIPKYVSHSKYYPRALLEDANIK